MKRPAKDNVVGVEIGELVRFAELARMHQRTAEKFVNKVARKQAKFFKKVAIRTEKAIAKENADYGARQEKRAAHKAKKHWLGAASHASRAHSDVDNKQTGSTRSRPATSCLVRLGFVLRAPRPATLCRSASMRFITFDGFVSPSSNSIGFSASPRLTGFLEEIFRIVLILRRISPMSSSSL